uniref:Uncharacterized protein n=1 Tax=Vitis vinifera TaxID=29760 RepID=F6HW28_VITVI
MAVGGWKCGVGLLEVGGKMRIDGGMGQYECKGAMILGKRSYHRQVNVLPRSKMLTF